MNRSKIIDTVINCRLSILKSLLKQETKESLQELNLNFTPLHYAALMGNELAPIVAEILIEYEADVNARYNKHLSTKLNKVHMQKYNITDIKESTPMQLAVMRSNGEVILVLLRAGAHMDGISQERRREILLEFEWREKLYDALLPHIDGSSELDQPLDISGGNRALCDRRYRRLKKLLEAGVNPNIVIRWGGSLLHWAGLTEDIESMKILIEYVADLEAVDMSGKTVLQIVTENAIDRQLIIGNRYELTSSIKRIVNMIKLLLRYGANPNACNIDGHTVFEFATGFGQMKERTFYQSLYELQFYKDTIEWLLIYGAELKSTKIEFFKENRLETGKVIIEYNLKRKLAGLKFQAEALIDIKDWSLEEFREQCITELEKMKTQVLFGNVTMYRFLRCTTRRSRVSAFKQEEVKEIYKQDLYETEYPIYKNLIEYNFIEGEKYESVFDSAYDNLDSLCNFSLPSVVLDKIINFISKKDMENIIKA